MIIDINDEIIKNINLNESEVRELIAIALFRFKKVNASDAGSIIGLNEFQFKVLFEEKGDLKYSDYSEEQLNILKNLKVKKVNNINTKDDL